MKNFLQSRDGVAAITTYLVGGITGRRGPECRKRSSQVLTEVATIQCAAWRRFFRICARQNASAPKPVKTLIGEATAVLEKGLQLALHLRVTREEDQHSAQMIAE